jgi:hypothetical protein
MPKAAAPLLVMRSVGNNPNIRNRPLSIVHGFAQFEALASPKPLKINPDFGGG